MGAHAPGVTDELAKLTFDDIMKMESSDLKQMFNGHSPFVSIPKHLWEDLMYFLVNMVDNIKPTEMYLSEMTYTEDSYDKEPRYESMAPDAQMCFAEYGRHKNGLIETLARIRAQVPGAESGLETATEDSIPDAQDNAQRTIKGMD